MSFTLILFIVFVLFLGSGTVALLRSKRWLGVGLLGMSLLPIAVVVLVVGAMTGLVGMAGGSANERLSELYMTPIPSTVQNIHFAQSTGGMDPTFWWECSPIDEGYLQAIIRNVPLTRAPKDAPPSALLLNWPLWWNPASVEAIPELYYSDSGYGGVRRVWVDRKRNRLFIVFMGT